MICVAAARRWRALQVAAGGSSKSALAISNADAEKPPFKSRLAVLKRWGFGTAKEAAPNGTASL
jgi:hypothetical protein